MRKRLWLLAFIALCMKISFTQQALIRDKKTKNPIQGVAVFNSSQSKSAVSNKKGEVDLRVFDKTEELFTKHVSYSTEFVTSEELQLKGMIIEMEAEEQFLDEVVYSVSRTSQKRSLIAEQIELADYEFIQKESPQTSADLLASVPGVRVQKSQAGGGSPVLRGFEANRVLLVVDGVRMNNAIYRNGHLQNSITIDPLSLERVEVLFGPASVIYGSDALGGVVHFYTKTPKFGLDQKVEGQLFARYTSANEEYTTHGNVSLSFKNWAYFGSFNYSSFGDVSMGKNRKHGFNDWGKVFFYSQNTEDDYYENPTENPNPNIQRLTGYDQYDLAQKFIVKTGKESSLTANIQFSTSSNIPRFDRLNDVDENGELRFAEWYYGPQRRWLTSIKYNFKTKAKWANSGAITTAYQNIGESRIQRRFGRLERSYRIENVDLWSLNANFTGKLNPKWDLYYGFELTHNDVASKGEQKTLITSSNRVTGFKETQEILSRYPNRGSTYTTISGYAKAGYTPNKKNKINLGLRYSYTFLNARWGEIFQSLVEVDQIDLSNQAVTYSASYIRKVPNRWSFSFTTSSGFRSPNIDDLGKIRERQGQLTLPNVDLKPEYVFNFELGIRKKWGRSNHFSIYGYTSLIDDYIFREEISVQDLNQESLSGIGEIFGDEVEELVIQSNFDKARVFGISSSFKVYLSKNWSIDGSITWTRGRILRNNLPDLPTPSIPPLFQMAHLTYDNGKLKSELGVNLSQRKKPEDFSSGGFDRIEEAASPEFGYPSWEIFNWQASYSFSKWFTAQVGVDNIFDRHYREFASGISAPGRSFSITGRFDF